MRAPKRRRPLLRAVAAPPGKDLEAEAKIVYEARLVNQGNGQYKGYPLNPEEWPENLP